LAVEPLVFDNKRVVVKFFKSYDLFCA